jgi:copper chaperone CopZ
MKLFSPSLGALLLFTSMITSMLTSTALCAAVETAPKPAKTKLKIAPHETVLHVADMHCATCAKKVASRLFTVPGVLRVRTDVNADLAVLTPQPKKKLDPLAIWKAAAKAGFPAVKLVGPEGQYTADPKTKAAVRVPPEENRTAQKPREQPG